MSLIAYADKDELEEKIQRPNTRLRIRTMGEQLPTMHSKAQNILGVYVVAQAELQAYSGNVGMRMDAISYFGIIYFSTEKETNFSVMSKVFQIFPQIFHELFVSLTYIV
jgi:hypothetical protein